MNEINIYLLFIVQLLGHVWLFVTPWTGSTPDFSVLHCLSDFAQTHIHWIGDALQPSYLLSSPSPPALNLSSIRVFSIVLAVCTGSQSIGASVSASVLSLNIQGWFPLRLTGLISLQSKGLSTIFSSTAVQKHQFFGTQAFFIVQLSHPYMTTGKTIALTRWTFVGKVMSLLFKMLSRLVIAFFQGASIC